MPLRPGVFAPWRSVTECTEKRFLDSVSSVLGCLLRRLLTASDSNSPKVPSDLLTVGAPAKCTAPLVQLVAIRSRGRFAPALDLYAASGNLLH
jgi:hypothetical protein